MSGPETSADVDRATVVSLLLRIEDSPENAGVIAECRRDLEHAGVHCRERKDRGDLVFAFTASVAQALHLGLGETGELAGALCTTYPWLDPQLVELQLAWLDAPRADQPYRKAG